MVQSIRRTGSIILEIFSKAYIYNKETYKIANNLKENTFEFRCLIATHKYFFMRKYDLTCSNICLCKRVYDKHNAIKYN